MIPRTSIDLNADVGEGCDTDAQLVPLVSSVNIACGAHAGDEDTMRRTVALALMHGAAIGAHPGFADRANFGRREMPVTPSQAAELVLDQTASLEAVAGRLGARVGHVKLHGALYNMASRDREIASAVVEALMQSAREGATGRALFALAGSELQSVARAKGIRVLGEAFADRSYRRDGTLTPRSVPGSALADEDSAVRQAVRLARDGLVRASDGTDIAVGADTLCIHGDGPNAAALARRIRSGLEAAGIDVRRPQAR